MAFCPLGMKRKLRIAALVFFMAAVLYWAVQGANRGWTKTSVPVRTVDEVTGNEGIQYQDRFLPGVDFLLASLLISSFLAGASLFLRNPKSSHSTSP